MLKLIKHTIEKEPKMYTPLLLLIDAAGQPDCTWVTGQFTPEGWLLDDDYRFDFFTVLEWYELPRRSKIYNENYYQIEINDIQKKSMITWK